MFNNIKGMGGILKQAKEMKENMKVAQENVLKLEADASCQDMIFVTAKGNGTFNVKITDKFKEQDLEMMEDMICITMKNAVDSLEAKKTVVMNEAVPAGLRGMDFGGML